MGLGDRGREGGRGGCLVSEGGGGVRRDGYGLGR